jgi:hypothetical protein
MGGIGRSILGRVRERLLGGLSDRWGPRRTAGGHRRARRDPARDRRAYIGDEPAGRPGATEPPASREEPHDPTLAGYYANLELPYGAGLDAVREARRRLLKRYHPDVHAVDPVRRQTATQLAQGLNQAHDELVRRLERKEP